MKPRQRSLTHSPILTLTLCLTAAGAAGIATADEPTARAIMERVDARDDGDNSTVNLEMVLIDRRGGERVRRIRSFSKDRGADTLTAMFFTHPPDVAGTGFLTHDYDQRGRDDDQWLYLPALRKTKRIASTAKDGSFMGSDFTYADLTSRNLDDYDYTLVKQTQVGGAATWVIEAIPRSEQVVDETGYTRSLLLVRQDNYYVVRAVHWLEGGTDVKYMDVKKLELIDGIWVGTEIHMTTRRNKELRHSTVLSFHDVRFGQDLDDDLFTVSRLEKGP